MFQNELDCII